MGDHSCRLSARETAGLSASEASLRGEALAFFAGSRHGFRVIGATGGRPGVVSGVGTWAYIAP